MAALKYSRQRESIKEFLMTRTDHPTADTVYENMKSIYPNISLGTVYRNLNSLVESGLLGKVSVPSGADRFDHILTRHYHIKCTHCGMFMNVEDMDYIEGLDEKVGEVTGFKMEDHDIVFNGVCPECQKLEAKEKN